MSGCILVLDKQAYREKEAALCAILKKRYPDSEIVYTEYEDDRIRRMRSWPLVGGLLQHLLYWWKSFVYAVRIMRRAGQRRVLCINPIVAIFLGLMNRRRRLQVDMCGFLFVPKKNALYYSLRKWVVRRSMQGLCRIYVYSQAEKAYYQACFPGTDSFRFVRYGIDYTADAPYRREKPAYYLFSGGGSNRDYATLVQAYRIFSAQHAVPLCIATLPQFLKGVDTAGIDVRTDVTLETIGVWIRDSALLVLSLQDVALSAGHQVLLQGLKEGVPILVNRIPAIQDYVSEREVTFFESGNAQDLANKMALLLRSPQRRPENTAFYQTAYTLEAFLERLLAQEEAPPAAAGL